MDLSRPEINIIWYREADIYVFNEFWNLSTNFGFRHFSSFLGLESCAFWICHFFWSTSASKNKLPDTIVPGEKICESKTNCQIYFKTSSFDPKNANVSLIENLQLAETDPVLEAGGKPSTWFPPGTLVELIFLNMFSICFSFAIYCFWICFERISFSFVSVKPFEFYETRNLYYLMGRVWHYDFRSLSMFDCFWKSESVEVLDLTKAAGRPPLEFNI